MSSKKWLLLGVAAVAAVAITASAIILAPAKTFRTTGFFFGVVQGHDAVSLVPQYDYTGFAGWKLVNLAMGRSLTDTNVPSQVMAMTVDCDLSAANLVVYDKDSSNVVATIAESTSFDAVKQQDNNVGPNRARFVAQFQINPNGNEINGLAGGYFTAAGRIHLDPATGCPKPVRVSIDKDRQDKNCGDKELSNKADPDEKIIQRAGLGHLIGVVDMITGGNTNTVLLPKGGLSIRRELPVPVL